jgi:predicted phosphodiesterase
MECGKTYFVRGNADKGHWAETIPATREFDLYGLQIYMIHNRKLIKDDISEQDMAKLVREVTRQMQAGKTVEEISQKNRVDVQIVNQILQIYTTHQGIDVQGILDRMEIAGR